MHGLLHSLALALCVLPACAVGQDVDLHAYWDQRCQGCHGHAGDFARRTLSIEQGRLQGRHHREDLDRFLRQHYLSDELVAPVKSMLLAQVMTTPLFAQKCAGCHGTAADFARSALAVEKDVLIAAASKRPLSQVLATHGRLTPAEVAQVVDSLRRIRSEVAGANR